MSLLHAGCAEVDVPFICWEQSRESDSGCSGIFCPANHAFHSHSHGWHLRLHDLKLFTSPRHGVWEDSKLPCLNELVTVKQSPLKEEQPLLSLGLPLLPNSFACAAQMWHLSLQCNRIGEEKTNHFKCEGKHWFFCVLPVPPPPGMNCNWIDTWCCSWQEWGFIEGRLRDKLWKGAGSFVARFLAPQMIFRVPGADCQPGDSRAAWQSRVRSSPGLQRVLCRHVSWPSLDLLLLPSLAKFAGGFLKKTLKFCSVSSFGFVCCLVRRSTFKDWLTGPANGPISCSLG